MSLAGSLYAIGGFAMMVLEDSDEIVPKEMNDIWRWVSITRFLFISTFIHREFVSLLTYRVQSMIQFSLTKCLHFLQV